MRVLIFDDEEVRHYALGRRMHDCVCVHVSDFDAAKYALAGEPFDMALLDHDVGSGMPDGTELAKYIVALPKEKHPRQVVVHSHNYDGAKRMVALFQDAGISATHRPFRG